MIHVNALVVLVVCMVLVDLGVLLIRRLYYRFYRYNFRITYTDINIFSNYRI